MEVKPGIGIGLIKFGMNREEVEFLFGEPSEINTDAEDDNKIIWVYNDEKMRLSFYVDEAYKLGYIETSSPLLKLSGEHLIGNKVDTAKKGFLNQKIENWETEKYPSFSTYFNEDFYLSLHESYGAITEVHMGVPFKNEEEFQWP